MKTAGKHIDILNGEIGDVATGRTAAAKVVEVVRLPDGTCQRQEIEPETDRFDTARNFAAKNDIARLRHRLNLSQIAFAEKLKISVSTLRKWESNATKPSGAAATLLDIIDRRPDVMEVL